MKLPTIIYTNNHPAMPDAEFLIRTKPPLIVCQVLHFDSRQQMEDFIRDNNVQAGANQYEGTTLTAYCGLLADYDWGDRSTQEIGEKMAGMIRRMSDWYYHNIEKNGRK